MRIHLRVNTDEEDDRLIRRWLVRFRKGSARQAAIRAGLIQAARAFFPDEQTDARSTPNLEPDDTNVVTPPVTIPSFENLGLLFPPPRPPLHPTTGHPPED